MPPTEPHPFHDEWRFQRSMSSGNPVAGQPIASDQPCFDCGVTFADHASVPPTDPTAALRTAAVQLRAAAVKAGAHIVVTTDYPDGVRAFGILCDAIDVMDAALAPQADYPSGEARRARNRARSMGEDASGGYREIAGCGCEECERHRNRSMSSTASTGPGTAPLTTEEQALMDELDQTTSRVINLVNVRLNRLIKTPKTREHVRASLRALAQDIRSSGLDDVERREAGPLTNLERRGDLIR